MNCRSCNHPLTHIFIDLGTAPPSNSFLSEEELNRAEVFYPLKVFVCDSCFLVQVAEYKQASEIFDSNYIYFSSYSSSWLTHARNYTTKMMERFHYNGKSLVMEIASNDGYLLQYFKEREIPVLGIEPTRSTADVALLKGIETRIDFFGVRLAKELERENRKADLLIGNNVLAHVPDLHDFIGGLKIALKEDGVITMEFPHVLQLVKQNQFDTIYQEHFSYLSFLAVQSIFRKHGLEVFDVDELPTHGGSLRIYAKHVTDQTKPVSPRVTVLQEKEKAAGIGTLAFYAHFQEKADQVKNNLLAFLLEQKQKGKKVCGYGAAAKGNTLLNYAGIRQDLIPYVIDASPHKQGKFLPGSRIPVYSEERIRSEQPDFVLILPWNIKDEVTRQLEYIRDWKGKFVVAVPELTIL